MKIDKNSIYLALFGILCVIVGALIGFNISYRRPPYSFAKSPFLKERMYHFKNKKLDGPIRRRKERFVKLLTEKLKLDSSQQEKIKEIFNNFYSNIETLFKNFHSKIKEIKEETDTKIMQILSPDQQEKFKELRQRFKRRWQ